jgi:hypothetical protein
MPGAESATINYWILRLAIVPILQANRHQN